jgi:hypothetical protein
MQRSVTRRVLGTVLPLLMAWIGAACASSAAATSPTPPTTTTESFSGEFNQLSSAFHTFTVSATGDVTITLTSVGPLSTMALGVSIEGWNGTSCTGAIAKNDNARSGAGALTGTAVAGNYCVKVYDSGNVPESSSVTYTIDVVHP